ncbi:ricin B lectin domain-containing protein, partial [Mycena latifolia]
NAGPQTITIFGDKCIDVTGGVNADGTKLQIWMCSGNTNQQWVSVTDSTLQWAGTDKCIDLTDGKITDGNGLQIWTCDSMNFNQRWVGMPDLDVAKWVLSHRGGMKTDSYHCNVGTISGGDGEPHSLWYRPNSEHLARCFCGTRWPVHRRSFRRGRRRSRGRHVRQLESRGHFPQW